MFICNTSINTIYRCSNSKFDLDFVRENMEFVFKYLKTSISLDDSSVLVNSIKKLQGKDHHFIVSLLINAVLLYICKLILYPR